MTQRRDENRDDGQEIMSAHIVATGACASRSFLPRTSGQRAVVGILSLLIVLFAAQSAHVLLVRSAALEGLSQARRHPGKLHSRPIIEREGRTLLWARGARGSPEVEWFDVTDSTIDPERFQYGIGKDTIPSIDSPQFLDANDPRLRDAGIDDETRVIGFAHKGDARAYPLHILNRHELVNDTVGGKPVTVGW
ncbi:MAG: DUF3179 domain-containing protein [Planctomycetes bacterium]|nr:DUF3179 domain-containing protein [Planctomycetota bacterium]